MGLVIRTVYNNQGWKSPCLKPGDDPECIACFTSPMQIKSPQKDDEVCSGDCWERDICVRFSWGCTPKGRMFARVHKGMKVFLAFKRFLSGYTIWGTTTVASIDEAPMRSQLWAEDGYAFVHFEPFEPLPREKWVSGLSDQQLVGEMWRQGRFRYIDSNREGYLLKVIGGASVDVDLTKPPPKGLGDNLSIPFSPAIIRRLNERAESEGRTSEELVREAVAEWLGGRDQQTA